MNSLLGQTTGITGPGRSLSMRPQEVFGLTWKTSELCAHKENETTNVSSPGQLPYGLARRMHEGQAKLDFG